MSNISNFKDLTNRLVKDLRTNIDVDEEVDAQHYGVKGMKWGIRKSATSSGKSKISNLFKKKRSSEKKSNPNKTKAKSIKEMSDAELREKVNRKRLEDDYRRNFPEKVSIGKRFVNSTLKDVVLPGVREGAKQIVTEQFKKRGNDYVDRLFETTLIPAMKK